MNNGSGFKLAIVVFPVCIAFVTTETFATKTPHIASFERASSTAAVFDMKLGPLNFEYPDSGQIQSVSVKRRQGEALLEPLEVGSELAKGTCASGYGLQTFLIPAHPKLRGCGLA